MEASENLSASVTDALQAESLTTQTDHSPVTAATSPSSISTSIPSGRGPASRASTTGPLGDQNLQSVNHHQPSDQLSTPFGAGPQTNSTRQGLRSDGGAINTTSGPLKQQNLPPGSSFGAASNLDGMYSHTATFESRGSQLDNHDGEYSAFGETDSQMFDHDADGQGRATPDPGIETRGNVKPSRKGSSTATNDLELKRLFRENQHRSLQEIAGQLGAADRGPQSEKTRQIFAMLWLSTTCKKSTGSIPRGRVYGNYVSRCGTERVTVLNPASFGKLVRVMFPGIQTRRLGMRGESKYHYCGLSLVEDTPSSTSGSGDAAQALPNPSYGFASHRSTPNPSIPADTAVFPAPSEPTSATTTTARTRSRRHYRVSSSLFTDSAPTNAGVPNMQSNMIQRELCFSTSTTDRFQEDDAIELPNIEKYMPIGTDPDTAATLTALYRHICMSLVDCIRYCREKHFFHLLSSFHGTLTVPVQKLLANPALAPWIKDCDWAMYQKMTRVVAPLTLQVVPKSVLEILKVVSQRLCPHIKSSFQSQPAHVVEAKLGPATVFCSLIERLLRVNMAAHAAANMLCNNANRDQMYEEWVMYVEALKIVQNELPNCGYEAVWQILTREIRGLLEPLNVPWELSGENASYEHTHNPSNTSTESVLDRWSSFLKALPKRFPGADARTVITCVNSVGTAALRDITMSGGKSFGSWWITKVWLDEMIAWLAESGGFLAYTPDEDRTPSAAIVETAFDGLNAALAQRSGEGSHTDSRFSSVSEELGYSSSHQPFDSSAPPQFEAPTTHGRVVAASSSSARPSDSATYIDGIAEDAKGTAAAAQDDAATGLDKDLTHDDSGVGMRLTDEDLSMGKFGFGSDGGIHASSDPAANGGDVVVC
ncbi:MAG: hypothetical protein M1825_004425 [Sarcosagium campestre]|nr:MAG: hypothetical protein M1825_004425 [Sarcosagium campestre]